MKIIHLDSLKRRDKSRLRATTYVVRDYDMFGETPSIQFKVTQNHLREDRVCFMSLNPTISEARLLGKTLVDMCTAVDNGSYRQDENFSAIEGCGDEL